MAPALNLEKQTFGRLQVIKRIGSNIYKQALWLCVCECGKKTKATSYQLRSGNSTSCGCSRKKLPFIHPREYSVWCGMKQRCHNPNNSHYKYYGSRGIRVCHKWKNSFPSFLNDVGKRPAGHSIDRIDATKGYSPGNVRWATSKTQNRNRRRTRYLTFNGMKKPLVEWAEVVGINRFTLIARIRKGLSHRKALTMPVRGRG